LSCRQSFTNWLATVRRLMVASNRLNGVKKLAARKARPSLYLECLVD
jgi:hypothetical protein